MSVHDPYATYTQHTSVCACVRACVRLSGCPFVRARVLCSRYAMIGMRSRSNFSNLLYPGGPISLRGYMAYLPLGRLALKNVRAHVCLYTCLYACLYTCLHTCPYTCLYTCLYACVHASAYTRIRMHAYTCLCTCLHARLITAQYVHTSVACDLCPPLEDTSCHYAVYPGGLVL